MKITFILNKFSYLKFESILYKNINFFLKLSNLSIISEALSDYYAKVLNQTLTNFKKPNLNVIIESADVNEVEHELSIFLQLTIGCAVKCKRNDEFISKIMTLDEQTQQVLMTIIQEVRF